MAKTVVGLDIGQRSVRAVEVEGSTRPRPLILRAHEVPLAEGAVVNGEVREVQTVASALRKLWSEGGFKSKRVVIGVGNQRVIARDLSVPKLPTIVHIREALPFQVQDMLPVPVSEALLDFLPVSESHTDQGVTVNGILVAAIKESVLANVKAVQSAGLTPLNVDLIPFALSRALIRGPLATATVVLIDVGATTTNVVVTANATPLFVRMIPVGGDDITKAVMTRLEIPAIQAEAFKSERGLLTAQPTTQQEYAGSEAIRMAAHDLLNSIRNTLQYFVTSRPGQLLEGIALSGGGAHLPGFAQALGEAMRLQVISTSAMASMDAAKSLKTPTQEREAYNVALGLAIGEAA